MLPLTFDRQILSSSLLDFEDAADRVLKVLRTIVDRRVLRWFEGRALDGLVQRVIAAIRD